MKRNLLLFYFSFFIFHCFLMNPFGAFAQNGWLWGNNGEGDARLQAIATDKSGNCIAAGFLCKDTVGFGIHTLIDTGIRLDFFLLKLVPNGSISWARQTFNIESSDRILSDDEVNVSADGLGNSYLTANFTDTMIIGTHILIVNDRSPASSSNFLAQYDSNGNSVPAKLPFGFCLVGL